MRHQVVVSLSGSGTYGASIAWLHRCDLRRRFAADLHRQPGDQRQGHHGSNGRECKIADTLGSAIMGSEYGRFGLQFLMEGFSKTLADVVGLSQGIADQMITLPILPRLRVAFESVEKDICLILIHFPVHQRRNFLSHAHHLLSSLVPNNGRKLAAIASRALKILDLTVPIGQSITAAISS